MTYGERFFIMASAILAVRCPGVAAKVCGPLANGEFTTILEQSFLRGECQERVDELTAYAMGGDAPSWYTAGVEMIASRLGTGF